MFKRHSFNVKLVKDAAAGTTVEDAQTNIETARAYAEIVVGVAEELSRMAFLLLVTKGVIEVAKIAAKAATR
jgi:hypothetical protein